MILGTASKDTSTASHKIKLHPSTTQHSLFPLLDYGLRQSYVQDKKLNQMELRIARIEQQNVRALSLLEELQSLIRDQLKASFNLKDGGFEVTIVTFDTVNNEFFG